MDPIITFLLILAAAKLVVIGVILFVVFRDDIRQWWSEKAEERKPPAVPICLYCQSTWTQVVDEGQTRWDGDELVLVHTYECQHCRLPFWHVERVAVGTLKR